MKKYQEPKYRVSIPDGAIINRQSGKPIPDDEPIFILRARDRKAAEMLYSYAETCTDSKHRDAVRIRAQQFTNWADAHPERMKEPDSEMDDGWTTRGTC